MFSFRFSDITFRLPRLSVLFLFLAFLRNAVALQTDSTHIISISALFFLCRAIHRITFAIRGSDFLRRCGSSPSQPRRRYSLLCHSTATRCFPLPLHFIPLPFRCDPSHGFAFPLRFRTTPRFAVARSYQS